VRSAQSAPQQGDRELRYPGTCRERFASIAEAEALSGKEAGLRFQVPEGSVEVRDELAGRVHFDVAAAVGDFHVARRDKVPAYQLAVVVDDAHQGVTEVLRGDDLLPSAARQQLLQRALGLPTPSWLHVPLVLDWEGRRLAKRADDLSLSELREGGTDPRAIVSWAAHSAGLRAPDRAAASELTEAFAIEHLPREPLRLTRANIEQLRTARR
jgi:glutamyl-tRNA synthetase